MLVLIGLLGFSFAWSQHRLPLGAGGDPAGSVEDQTEEEEEDGNKRVAGYGHQRSCGQARRVFFRFHNEDGTAVSRVCQFRWDILSCFHDVLGLFSASE